MPALYAELEERSFARMRVFSGRAMGICLTCYVLVGLAGYRDAPTSASGNLLSNYCISREQMMLPAWIAIGLAVCIAYPFNVHPCRYTLDVMLFGQFGAKRSALRHVLWTVGIAGTGLLVALYVPGINVVFQLMGSTCSAFVCFILPGLFGLKLRLPEASGVVGLAKTLALIVGGGGIGIAATYTTTAGLFAGVGDGSSGGADPHGHGVCDRADTCVY